MSIGADVENGKWAMLGARCGCYMSTLDTNYDITLIRDLEFMGDKIDCWCSLNVKTFSHCAS
jgi:hypothetical protein